jgi:hypothetical protein
MTSNDLEWPLMTCDCLPRQVPTTRLRPKPPAPPADWQATLKPGHDLEMSHEQGWWPMKFVARQRDAPKLLLHSTLHGTRHLIDASETRPGWKWSAQHGGEWTLNGVAAGAGSAGAGASGGRGMGGGRGRGRGRGGR